MVWKRYFCNCISWGRDFEFCGACATSLICDLIDSDGRENLKLQINNIVFSQQLSTPTAHTSEAQFLTVLKVNLSSEEIKLLQRQIHCLWSQLVEKVCIIHFLNVLILVHTLWLTSTRSKGVMVMQHCKMNECFAKRLLIGDAFWHVRVCLCVCVQAAKIIHV